MEVLPVATYGIPAAIRRDRLPPHGPGLCVHLTRALAQFFGTLLDLASKPIKLVRVAV